MVRRTVTLDAKVVELATAMSKGNFSAYVNEAVGRQARQDALAEMMEEDERRRGPIDRKLADQIGAELDALDRR